MDKSVLSAVISSVTKEEVEKRIPEIRKMVSKEVYDYLGSKSGIKKLKLEIQNDLEDWISENISDMLNNTTINRLVRKTINKIV